MTDYKEPLIDQENPFYCPEISATSYVDSLRQLQALPATCNSQGGKPSFARIFEQAMLVNFRDSDPQVQLHHPIVYSGDDDSSPSLASTYPIPAWEQEDLLDHRVAKAGSIKRRLSFSSDSSDDIKRPAKHGRSFQSVHDSSFDISIQAQRLHYFAPNEGYARYSLQDHSLPGTTRVAPNPITSVRIRALEDELFGPPIGSETPRGLGPFIARLDAILPGIRLGERLQNMDDPTHQKIANILAENGLLNARILDLLRTSEIRSLSLTASLPIEGGLNISGRDMLYVFKKPNSFLFLSELSFSDTPVVDFDLVHIHHLPSLATLILHNTGIGNEAVFLLTSLKRTLNQLCISSNPRIGNYAVPALLLLSKLSFLSILGTNIDMSGLRRLAVTVYKEDRVIGIEIPAICEFYLDNLHSRYLLCPSPPLITNPAACAALSVSALKRNLVEHAKCNSDIAASGTKAEMANRLETILKTRKLDLLVRDLVWGT